MGSTPKPQELFAELKQAQPAQIAEPDKNLDKLVQDIFDQAKDHRKVLIRFYIWYTVTLSALVMALILWQAAARFFVHGDSKIELVPNWALDLIVVGMFGQFIGLLTIVTKRVWEFKPFLDHVNQANHKSPNK